MRLLRYCIIMYFFFCIFAYSVPKYGYSRFVKFIKKEQNILRHVYSKLPGEKWRGFEKNIKTKNLKKACFIYAKKMYQFILKKQNKHHKKYNKNYIKTLETELKHLPGKKALSLISEGIVEISNKEKNKKTPFFITPFISCFYNLNPHCFEFSFITASLAKLAGYKSTISIVVYPNSLAIHAVCLVNTSRNNQRSWYILDSNFPGSVLKLDRRIGYNYCGYSKKYGKIYPSMFLYIFENNKKNYKWIDTFNRNSILLELPDAAISGEFYLHSLEILSNFLLKKAVQQPLNFYNLYYKLEPVLKKLYQLTQKFYPHTKKNFYFQYHKSSLLLLNFLYLEIDSKKNTNFHQFKKKLGNFYQKTINSFLYSLSLKPTILVIIRLDYLFKISGNVNASLNLLENFSHKKIWLYARLLKINNLILLKQYSKAKYLYRIASKSLKKDVKHIAPSKQDQQFIFNILKYIKNKLNIKVIDCKKLKVGA